MPRKPKRYWRIEIEERHEVVFRRKLPGNLTENEIGRILQRLACRDLSAAEIIACSRRKNWKTSLLRVSFDLSSKGQAPYRLSHQFSGIRRVALAERRDSRRARDRLASQELGLSGSRPVTDSPFPGHRT